MSREQPRILVAIDPSKRPEDALTLGVRLARVASAPLEIVAVFLTFPKEPEDRFFQEARERTEAHLADLAVQVEARKGPMCAPWAPCRRRGRFQQLSEADDVGLVVIGSTTRGPVR